MESTELEIENNLRAIVARIIQIGGLGCLPVSCCVRHAVRSVEECMVVACPELKEADGQVKQLIEQKLFPIVEAHFAAQNFVWSA